MDGQKPQMNRGEYVQGDVFETNMESTVIFPQSSQSPTESTSTTIDGNNLFCIIGKDPEKPEYRCYPYKKSMFRNFLMILSYIFSAGFMWLVFYWRPDWKLKFSHYHSSFDKCTSVFLEVLDGTQRVYVSKIEVADAGVKKWAPYLFSRTKAATELLLQKGVMMSFGSTNSFSDQGSVKYFVHHLSKYMWDGVTQTFVKIEGYDGNVNLEEVHTSANNPICKDKAETMRELFGENVIHVEIPSYISLLVAEVLNPFYVFQFAACLFWMVDEYYVYATAILIISFISAIVSLITVRRERVALHDMVERHNSSRISVVREIKEQDDCTGASSGIRTMRLKQYVTEDIWIKDLVPGDVVAIPSSGVQLSFDAALISGSCIVNESMLTGESVPVTKTSLPSGESELSKHFSVEEQKSHILFCGTEVVQTRYYQDEIVRAVVVRTGYGTAKGQLVHSILFPKPVNLELMRDAYRFVGVMCLIALVGFAYSAYTLVQNSDSVKDIVFKSIDIITITVPPALPLAMTIGIIYAQDRLKKAFIRTISPQRINICGQVDVVAFDKTGTLTEEGLDLACVVPSLSARFQHPLLPKDLKMFDKSSNLLRCMATCHSLTVIEGETTGDPLDLKMFEGTGFELVEPKVDETTKYDQLRTTFVRPVPAISDDLVPETNNSVDSVSEYEVGIIRQFPFLSSLQRASVIAKTLISESTDTLVYVKGAPETIAKLCLSETIPEDFMEALKTHTQKGYRVIALSFKSMNMKWRKAQKIERKLVENDLTFLGFMILQNQLKPMSEGVINELDRALIRTVMVTGDNLETAICVGRDCKILKPGKTILRAQCDCTGMYPTLKWQRIEAEDSKTKRSLSSSSSLSETIISMGDNFTVDDCHLVVTGFQFSAIKQYFPQFVKPMAVQGAVFARMSPAQKTELMEELEAVDYHTLMCGDGANDCGALKRAHVGLSLSELEASVAAPFTANIENGISSVVTLIREGRAALVTSFGMFKFMALYSMIQFTTILLLYRNNTILSDLQFLFIDLIIIDFIAITMSRNYAYKHLHSKRPPSSLVTLEMLLSLLLQIFLQMGLQIYAFLLLQQQCWYTGPIIVNETSGEFIHDSALEHSGKISAQTAATTPNSILCPALAHADNVTSVEEDTPKTYETTTLFYLSAFMYLSVSVAFSHGRPFRTPIYKNRWFLGSLVLLMGFTLFMMFGAPLEFNEFMELWRIPDMHFLFVLCGIVVVHLIMSLLIEIFLIENPCVWYMIKSLCARKTHTKRYKNIELFLQNYALPNPPRNEHCGIDEDIAIPAMFDGQTVNSKIAIDDHKTNSGFLKHL